MKRIVALVLASLLMVSLFSVAFADTYGLAAITTYGAVKDAGVKDNEKYDGTAPTDTIICSIVLDDEGKIKSVLFDNVQVRTKFTAEGKLAEGDYTAPVQSKIDKGEAYGMKKASPISKEWFEQIAAFEAYCIGKTVEEVQNMPTKVVNESHPTVPDVADLTTTVTIDVGSYIEALVKAAGLAK